VIIGEVLVGSAGQPLHLTSEKMALNYGEPG
jgi:hypothetical protein